MPDPEPHSEGARAVGTASAAVADEPLDAPAAPRAPAAPPGPRRPITDVWSWTARKYRIRAVVLLLANLLLFCGLCAFTHWLHVAQVFDFRLSTYLEPLRFWGPQTQNLYDFIRAPISVDVTPIHGVVIGLLFAAIVAVPISVAILYGLACAWPFIAAVLVFAHLPWMAITLAGSCILAAVRPFRMTFRFGSALLAMLPVLAYLLLATRGPVDALGASLSPERKLLLAGPWLLAVLAACTMLAVIIFIARIVNFRPGAVAPVMAIMFATPTLIFHQYVGVDELHYRDLEAKYGPRSEPFQPVTEGTERILDIIHELSQPDPGTEPRRAALLGLWNTDPQVHGDLKHLVLERLLLDLMDQRRAAADTCADFIADHPSSRYVPNVLFIQARALDTRLDERALLGPAARRELYTDFPHRESEAVWTNLAAGYPYSPLAHAARLRLAQLLLRKGEARGALEVLTVPAEPEDALDEPVPAETRPARVLLPTIPPETSLEYDPDADRFESQRLRELIEANAGDPRHGVQPLQALACLDAHRPGYREQLARLAAQYRDSLLCDNLVVLWAGAALDRNERAALLRGCVHAFPDGDALPEALFELGDLEVQTFGLEEQRRAEGLARLREIMQRFGQTCWARRAAERLRMIAPPDRGARGEAP